MRTIIAALFAFGLVLQAAKPVPRPADELKVVEPSGKTITLSSQKGKVVIVQFLFTWCEHCQNTARMLSKIESEFAPRGVQVLGVAFNDEVNTPDKAKNALQVSQFGSYANFPVGLSSRADVLKYLGISVMERFAVPQIMVVDKKGVIQAQTKPMPSGQLQNETYLRGLINKLLSE